MVESETLRCELWQLIAFFVGLDPDKLPILEEDELPFRNCPKEFKDMLQIACSNADISFPVKTKPHLRARSVVEVSDVAPWLKRISEECND